MAQGGVRKVGSNAANGRNIIDGNLDTFWKPVPDDSLKDWWIEIDLGRLVPVTRIRLLFPDQEGARPFREFRVFGSDGYRVSAIGEDIFSFDLIGGTTSWNEQAMVEYQVRPTGDETTLVFGDTTAFSRTEGSDPLTTSYLPLQYLRIRADSKSPDAALAEVEVYTLGENISLGTFARGGSIVEPTGRGSAMVDGDANTGWVMTVNTKGGLYDRIVWEWDLGTLFWIDRIAMIASQSPIAYDVRGIFGHQLLTSDGRRALGGAIDYDHLFDLDLQYSLSQRISYLFFSPRPIRYLSSIWTQEIAPGSNQLSSGNIAEIAIFPVGYVAQVELTSGYIDLGAIAGDQRPKVIHVLNWEADLPPGARVQAHTRSGNTLRERTLYFHRDGTEITEAKWNSLTKALRGETRTITEVGEDWSEWSSPHQLAGEKFRSPSPRRYVQVKLLLSSDRPTTAPTLHSFSLIYTNAFLAGVKGEIQPRIVLPGIPQTFSYRIIPQFKAGDSGFNRILLETPSLADADSLSFRIAGREVEPTALRISPDSLVVDLPQIVRQNEVEVKVHLSITQNGYPFKASVGHTQQPELWQSVDPAERFATTIFFSAVPETRRFIANFSIHPRLLTPNGDGVGEEAEIRFSILKVEQPALVRIYALDGGLIQELARQHGSNQVSLYTWSGRDQSGVLVSPGIYLCQISLETQVGKETLTRTISVAY